MVTGDHLHPQAGGKASRIAPCADARRGSWSATTPTSSRSHSTASSSRDASGRRRSAIASTFRPSAAHESATRSSSASSVLQSRALEHHLGGTFTYARNPSVPRRRASCAFEPGRRKLADEPSARRERFGREPLLSCGEYERIVDRVARMSELASFDGVRARRENRRDEEAVRLSSTGRSAATRSRFSVSVPVLSEAITVALPRVSTAVSRRAWLRARPSRARRARQRDGDGRGESLGHRCDGDRDADEKGLFGRRSLSQHGSAEGECDDDPETDHQTRQPSHAALGGVGGGSACAVMPAMRPAPRDRWQ